MSKWDRRLLAILMLVVLCDWVAWMLTGPHVAMAQSGRVFYIDYVGGSNANNGTSTSTPWKTAPQMNHSAGCDSSTGPTYAHQAGDRFAFKGGVTWPAACFTMFVAAGGTSSSVKDYYGVCLSTDSDSPCSGGTSWPSTGWTRPLFDMNYTFTSSFHVVDVGSGVSFVTFDNIEVYRQLIHVSAGYLGAGYAFRLSLAGSSLTVENSYIHDWGTNENFADATYGDWGEGCIGGGTTSAAYKATMLNSTCSDTNGYFFSGGSRKNIGFGGSCEECLEVSGSTFTGGFAACWSVLKCHDSQFHDVTAATNPYCNATGSGCHSQVIENDIGAIGEAVYNNLIINNTAAVIVFQCAGDSVYNNVMYGNAAAGGDQPIMLDSNCGSTASTVSKVYNNTVDCGGGQCFRAFYRSGYTFGILNLANNLWVNGSSTPACYNNTAAYCAPIGGTSVLTPNYNMPTSEAATYGFIAANKYKPSLSDPHVAGQGTNLTSSCAGNLIALCNDTSGASWFGGSYIARGSSWDLGAYMGQGGGGGGPPTSAVTVPSNNATISGPSVTLTQTCVTQGGATISSMQFFVDGIIFGSAGSASPYSVTLDSTKMANTSHTIWSVCTDSNAQTNQAPTVNVTVSNSIPGCNISQQVFTNPGPTFTTQSGDFTYTVNLTPLGTGLDEVFAVSNAQMTNANYSAAGMLIRANPSGNWDVYNGTTSSYGAATTVAAAAGTQFTFSVTVHHGAGTYDVAETAPASNTLATGYLFRSTAVTTSFGFYNAISGAAVYDNMKVCNFQVASGTTLTFNPTSVAFGNVTTSLTSNQTLQVSATGGTVNFSSKVISGDASFTISTDGCGASTATNCNIILQFAPITAGAKSANLVLTDDATGSPQSILLTGTGVASSVAVSCTPASISFGSVQIHVPQVQGPIDCVITNGPALAMSVAVSGTNAGDFSPAQNSCTGSISASCTVSIQYYPRIYGSETATITVSWTGGSQAVTVNGTGVYPPRPAPF